MQQRARTEEAKNQRRQALLAAALDEFFERGFTAARMDDIAARADVSKGALYLYFNSKEALFAALVENLRPAECGAHRSGRRRRAQCERSDCRIHAARAPGLYAQLLSRKL